MRSTRSRSLIRSVGAAAYCFLSNGFSPARTGRLPASTASSLTCFMYSDKTSTARRGLPNWRSDKGRGSIRAVLAALTISVPRIWAGSITTSLTAAPRGKAVLRVISSCKASSIRIPAPIASSRVNERKPRN